MKTKTTLKTVQQMIDNKALAKLSEGKAFIKYLKQTFKNTNVEIDVDEEYNKFLTKHPEYK